jgi:hypothetical protein
MALERQIGSFEGSLATRLWRLGTLLGSDLQFLAAPFAYLIRNQFPITL